MRQRTALGVGFTLLAGLAGCAADMNGLPRASGLGPREKAPGLSLTIYSSADPGTFDPLAQLRMEQQGTMFGDSRVPGYGVVRDTRMFKLQPGPNALTFTDVASGIDPTTVSFRAMDGAADLSVLEQNFRFDLFSSDKLLKKYVGKPVTVTTEGKAGGKSTVSGTLLASNTGDLILRASDGTVQILGKGEGHWQIGLASDAGGLSTKPTLELVVQASKAEERAAQVTYQTDNLTWRADYSLLLNKDDTAGDLSTWVTLVNQSGASYPGTQLKLIAGDVRRFAASIAGVGGGLNGNATAGLSFTENPFFEYHMYTLGGTVDLPENSIKQVELISPRSGFTLEKAYVFDYAAALARSNNNGNGGGGGLFTNTQQNGEVVGKVDVCVKIKNTESNHMGIALPAGRVRVYKKDTADGAAEFVGEDVITHTPKDETLTIVIGKAFDIVGTQVRTNMEQDTLNRTVAETFEVVLRNHKSEAVRVVIREQPNSAWWWQGAWRVTECTEKYEAPNMRILLISVDIPRDGEKKVTYTVRYDGK